MNADQAELEKFSSWGSTWWDPDGEHRLLHRVNPLRLSFIDQRASLSGKRALDVGCGGGILTEGMASCGADALGIDLADGVLKAAEAYAQSVGSSTRYRKVSVEDLANEAPHSFDVITCMEMLEHVPDPASIVKSLGRLVKPGGHVFMSTFNRNPASFIAGIVGLEYVLKVVAKGTHTFSKFIKPAELYQFVEQAGLKPVESRGIMFNPLTERFSLINATRVNYIVHARPR